MADTENQTVIRNVDDALQHIGFGRFHTVLLLCAGLAYFGDAVEVMLLSYLGPTLRCQWDLGPEVESLLTSVVFAGMMVGSALWSTVSDMRGRKPAVAAMASFTAVFGILSAASPGFQVILFTRFFVGVGLAGVPAVFTLLMEYVPPRSRGFWMVFIESFWTLGTVMEAGLAALILPRHGWRVLLLVSALPLVVLVLLSPILHESPRYFLATGRAAEAEQLLGLAAKQNGKAAALPPLDLQLLCSPPTSKPNSPAHSPQCRTSSTAPASLREGLSYQPLLHHHPHHQHQHQASIAAAASTTHAAVATSSPRPHPIHAPLLAYPASTPPPHRSSSPLPHTPNGMNRLYSARWAPSPMALCSAAAHDAGHQLLLAACTVSRLFRGGLLPRTLLLMLVWFTNGLAYYAVVLLSTTLVADRQQGQAGAKRTLECQEGRAPFTSQDFVAILVTSAAELPSIAFAAGIVDDLGRRWSMVLSLALTAAALTPLAAGLCAGLALQTVLLFIARLFIMASFAILWVYTPELYPAYVRTLGLGLNNSVARVGGVVAPFLAVGMVRRGAPHVAEGIIVLLCCVAAVAVWAIGVESAGRVLDQAEGGDEAVEQREHDDF